MKKHLLCSLLMAFCLTHFQKMTAQVYIEYGDGAYPVDLCACEVDTEPLNNQFVDPYGMGADPDGNVYFIEIHEIYKIDATTGDVTFVASLPGDNIPICLVYGSDGLLYTTVPQLNGAPGEVLLSIDPTSGTVTILGNMPGGFSIEGDLFFYQGQLYGTAGGNGGSVLLQIPIGNPGAATVVHDFPGLSGLYGAISVIFNGVETVFMLGFDGTSSNLYQLDMASGGVTLFCNDFGGGDLAAPPNYELNCCSNEAGNLVSLDLTTACQNQNITLAHLGDEILNPDAALSFVLVADSTMVLPNGIVQISANPTFSFDAATMVLGQIYFVAAVAAPGAPGSPDWAAGCRDVSFFAPVLWLALPTASFSGVPPEICDEGCQTVSVNFTGTPPFALTYKVTIGANEQTFTESFQGSSGSFQVCPPSGFTGTVAVEGLDLTDANCDCEP